MNIDEKYKKAGEIISGAGGTPIPVNDTLIKLLKYLLWKTNWILSLLSMIKNPRQWSS